MNTENLALLVDLGKHLLNTTLYIVGVIAARDVLNKLFDKKAFALKGSRKTDREETVVEVKADE